MSTAAARHAYPVNTDETVLGAGSVALASRVDSDGVDRTAACNEFLALCSRLDVQVSLNTTNLLLEHTVPEPALKLSTTRVSRRNRHGILSTANDDLALSVHVPFTSSTHIRSQRRDGGTVERGLGREHLHLLECVRVEYLIESALDKN
jgi:hypothetical protein